MSGRPLRQSAIRIPQSPIELTDEGRVLLYRPEGDGELLDLGPIDDAPEVPEGLRAELAALVLQWRCAWTAAEARAEAGATYDRSRFN